MDKKKKNKWVLPVVVILMFTACTLYVVVEVNIQMNDLDYCHNKGYDGIETRGNIFNNDIDVCYKRVNWNNITGKYDREYGEIYN